MSHVFPEDLRGRDAAAGAWPVAVAGAPFYRRAGKRALDLALVSMALPVVLPVVALLWLLLWLEGGSGFYRQQRIGRGGRVFSCIKLRTMHRDAERQLRECLAADPLRAREWQEHQKLADDPRVTRLGRFLRRTSLDELPQLWNVLRGDMSLIGPRPFTPEQKRIYDREPGAETYYRLRPGISGLWQVEARHNSAFRCRVAYDSRYEASLSLKTDLLILLRTVGAVLRASGA